MEIHKIISELINSYNYTRASLANDLGVSSSTVRTWIKENRYPSSKNEGKLREIYTNISIGGKSIRELKQAYAPRLLLDEVEIRNSVADVFTELREAFHKRGRISSRNQALEEVSKLIFTHVLSKNGINFEELDDFGAAEKGIASALCEFVKSVFSENLPTSLGYRLSASDFSLMLRPDEDDLAREIIWAFDHLSENSDLKQAISQSGIDIINEVFGSFLVDSFANEKELGQYLTPPEVVQFMTNLALEGLPPHEYKTLLDPHSCASFGLIMDPSCGAGSFLAEMLRGLEKEVYRIHGESGRGIWLKNMANDVIWGIDRSERMIKLALANLAMFGAPAARLTLANSLDKKGDDYKRIAKTEGKVKLILTNPPFGAEFRDDELSDYEMAIKPSGSKYRKVESEILFLERYIELLTTDGYLLAVIPDSVLTNKGIYQQLREYLSSKLNILGVISLPQVTFAASGTNTKTSILYAKKSETDKNPTTFFAICEDVGYDVKVRNSQRLKRGTGNGNLPEILKSYKQYNDTDISRWVEKIEGEKRWDAQYHASVPLQFEERLSQDNQSDLRLRDVAILINEREDPRRWGIGEFNYIEISDIDTESERVTSKKVTCKDAPSRARKLVRTNDILISTVRPERNAVGVVGKDLDGAICSTGIAVVRPKNIDPIILAKLLKSEFVTLQILKHTLGLNYPAFDESCLPEILLPMNATDTLELEGIAERVASAHHELSRLEKNLSDSLANAIQKWTKQL